MRHRDVEGVIGSLTPRESMGKLGSTLKVRRRFVTSQRVRGSDTKTSTASGTSMRPAFPLKTFEIFQD